MSEMPIALPLSVAATIRCRNSEHPLKLLVLPLGFTITHVRRSWISISR
jgi:hypothetical protein